MNFQSFGEHLEYIRIEHHLTRTSLSDGICSEKQLYRIEKSESEPSIFILSHLSLRLNIDLLDLYRQYNLNIQTGFKEIVEINTYLRDYDIRNLKKYLNTLNFSKFESNPLFKETYYYALASCFYVLDCDYKSSLFYINKGLLLENDTIAEDISNNVFSNNGYCLLNLKASIFLRQKEYQKACFLFIAIKESLEKYFITPNITGFLSPTLIHKIYSAILSNMIICYYNIGEYEKTIYYSDIAISYSIKNYIMRHFQIVLDYKARALYQTGKYQEASRLFNTAITLYEMDTDYDDYLINLRQLIVDL